MFRRALSIPHSASSLSEDSPEDSLADLLLTVCRCLILPISALSVSYIKTQHTIAFIFFLDTYVVESLSQSSSCF